jgi:RES domain-containing protein
MWGSRSPTIETVSRLTRRQYASNIATALNGAGGIHSAGRWHKLGQPIVYTAGSRALALLERTVHLEDGVAAAGDDLVFFDLRIPHDVSRRLISPDRLDQLATRIPVGEPPDWRTADHPMCQRIGSQWLLSGESCLLIVPSAVTRHDPLVLINPHHPEIEKLVLANQDAFTTIEYRWDRRLADVIDLAAGARLAAGKKD